jgi:hypothetical protein
MYLSLIHPNWLKVLIAIKLENPINRKRLSEALYLAEKYQCIGVISNYRNPMSAKFDRYESSGLIKPADLPTRLEPEALLEKLDELHNQKHFVKPRRMNPNSIRNLRPAPPFKKGHVHRKRSKVSPEAVVKAIKLREEGVPWRLIADTYALNHETLRSAANKHLNSGGLTELKG